jgi:DNA-binding NarL/FixJ family response regulator
MITGVRMVKTSQPLRLLIVDDHVVIREALRMLIESQPSMKVVAMAGNRAEAIQRQDEPHPT